MCEFEDALQEVLRYFSAMIVAATITSFVSLQIKLEKGVVISRSPYRLAEIERDNVRKSVSNLMSIEIIRPSESPFASPVLLVKKKGGLFRELN